MGISYNVRQFEELRSRLSDVAQGKFLPELGRRLGAQAIKLLADEFRESRNPYGVPWKPVFRNRKRDRAARMRRYRRQSRAGQPLQARPDKPLIDTGRLRAAAVSQEANQSSGNSVRIVIPVSYASYHQDGTRRIPRRQILPAPPSGLGFVWGRAFDREAKRVLREALKAAGGTPTGGGG